MNFIPKLAHNFKKSGEILTFHVQKVGIYLNPEKMHGGGGKVVNMLHVDITPGIISIIFLRGGGYKPNYSISWISNCIGFIKLYVIFKFLAKLFLKTKFFIS